MRSVFIAFGADTATNPNVARSRQRLTASLRAAGYHVYFIEWDASLGKGLDDLLARAFAA
jgi:hypothetical protein